MLTIFTIPKAFRDHTDVIQTNAILSWLRLYPQPEIILFGDDKGTSRIASQLSIRHVPTVQRNEYGTPLLNSIFKTAQDIAHNPLICYVNADIILLSDFIPAVRQVHLPSFLIVGQRWDLDFTEPINFDDKWESRLRTYLAEKGKLHPKSGIDYFAFTRGLYKDIPPFAIGRTTWDNWLIYKARSEKAPVIDATKAITAVHQNHDYSHHTDGAADVWKGPEAKRNQALAGRGNLSLEHATWILTSQGMRRALTMRYLYFRLCASTILTPWLGFLYKPMRILTELIINVRSTLGIKK